MTHRALPASRARRASWVRTCVGCRQRAAASELLRFIATSDEAGTGTSRHRLVPDPSRRAPGRGAHIHPDLGCLALARRRRALGRALRVSGVPDDGALVEHIDPDKRGRTTDMSTR